MRLRLIGLSVSACIRDIISGAVDEADVAAIVGGTDINSNTSADVERVVNLYADVKNGPWRANPKRAKEVFMRLWTDGKIIQPRRLGLPPLLCGGGTHWAVQADFKTVKTMMLMRQIEEDNYGEEHQGS